MAENTITPPDLESPQAALNRSENLEAAILDACDGALASFLAKMTTATLAGTITRGTAIGYWKSALTTAMSHPTFSAVRADLISELDELPFADDAYDAAEMAIATCKNMQATPEDRTDLITDLFAHPDASTQGVVGLIAALSDKVDAWLRRRISRQILKQLRNGGSLENPTLIPEAPLAPHPTGTLVTPGDWENDDRPGDINWRDRMQRDIRTAYTRIFGRQMQRQLEKAGYTQKMWVTRHDDRVRPTHVVADNQIVKIGSSFEVGGEHLRYPGDPSGSASETINCRCVMVGVPK